MFGELREAEHCRNLLREQVSRQMSRRGHARRVPSARLRVRTLPCRQWEPRKGYKQESDLENPCAAVGAASEGHRGHEAAV